VNVVAKAPPADLPVKGIVWLSKDAEEFGQVFPVFIRREGNAAYFRVGGELQCTPLQPERWERWNVKARDKDEAEKTVRHHFYTALEVVWP
jgi:hypothetical protein